MSTTKKRPLSATSTRETTGPRALSPFAPRTNLFIGIVMNSMSEMHAELDEQKAARRAAAEKGSILDDVAALDQQLASLKSKLTALRAKLPQSSS